MEWLRALSWAPAIGSVILVYQIGKRSVGHTTAIVSCFMIAVSPKFIEFSQELRMYSLGTFWVLAGTLALIRNLESSRSEYLGWWALFRVLGALTTPLSSVILAADAVIIFARWRDDLGRLRLIAPWAIIIAAIVAPYVWRTSTSLTRFMAGWISAAPEPTLPRFASMLFKTFPVGTSPLLASFGHATHFVYLVIMATLGLIAVVAARRCPKKQWVALWALLPAFIFVLFSWSVGSLWTDRYLFFIAPFVLILIAEGFVIVWARYRLAAIVVVLFHALAVGSGMQRYYNHQGPENWRAVVEAIAAKFEESDAIVMIGDKREATALTYYLPARIPVFFTASLADHSVVRAPLKAWPKPDRSMSKPIPQKMSHEEMMRSLNLYLTELPHEIDRIWVVYRASGDEQLIDSLGDAIANRFHQANSVANGKLQLLQMSEIDESDNSD